MTIEGLSHTYACIHSPPNSGPIQAVTKHWAELPVLHSRMFLFCKWVHWYLFSESKYKSCLMFVFLWLIHLVLKGYCWAVKRSRGASRGEEFNPGPMMRFDHSELLCNKVLLKYKGNRESFWHRHQKGVETVPLSSLVLTSSKWRASTTSFLCSFSVFTEVFPCARVYAGP